MATHLLQIHSIKHHSNMKLPILSLKSFTSSAMPTPQIIERRKKFGLPKAGSSNAPSDPSPEVGKDTGKNIGKDSPPSTPNDGPSLATALTSDMGKDIPQSIPTNAAAAVSDGSKVIPTALPKADPSPTRAAAAPSTVTATMISTTAIFSSVSTTTVHHTETETVTGTDAASALASTPSGPIRAGASLSGAVTQKGVSHISPVTVTMASTTTPQADQAPTCSALPMHKKQISQAEITAIVFGLITLVLGIVTLFLIKKIYQIQRSERVWGKQVQNEGTDLQEIKTGTVAPRKGKIGDDVAENPFADQPALGTAGRPTAIRRPKTSRWSIGRRQSWEK